MSVQFIFYVYNNSSTSGAVMGRFVDRAGQKFGRLTVISRAGTDANLKVVWRCLCECGKEALVTSGSLVTGNTVSCGCFLKERITKHGGFGKSSYNTWRAMMRRCYVLHDKDYPRWGGAGISVAARWHDYKQFAADMGEPVGSQTLDRIDPYGNYCLENCRWASATTQARNIRIKKNSTSGVTGVVRVVGGKWMASITAKKRRYYSKVFENLFDAMAARKELELKYWGGE